MFCTVFTSQHCLSSDITWAPTGNSNKILLTRVWLNAACGCCLWQAALTDQYSNSKIPIFSCFLFILLPPLAFPTLTERRVKDTWRPPRTPLMNYSKYKMWKYHDSIINHTIKYRWRVCFGAQVWLFFFWQYIKLQSGVKINCVALYCTAFKWLNMWHTYHRMYVI